MSAAFSWFFLSLKGRISRQEYWLGIGAIFALIFLIDRPLQNLLFFAYQQSRSLLYFGEITRLTVFGHTVIVILIFWPLICLYAKRLHDLNRSGWWLVAVVVLAVLLNFKVGGWNAVISGFQILLGLVPGNRAENSFGDAPPVRAG